jgi:hypothetical protein
MDENTTISPDLQSHPNPVPQVVASPSTLPTSVKKGRSFISFFILIIILGAIPATVIFLGQQTRQEIKAATECKTPSIPDPTECPGGDWKLYKNESGCVRFRCEPR